MSTWRHAAVQAVGHSPDQHTPTAEGEATSGEAYARGETEAETQDVEEDGGRPQDQGESKDRIQGPVEPVPKEWAQGERPLTRRPRRSVATPETQGVRPHGQESQGEHDQEDHQLGRHPSSSFRARSTRKSLGHRKISGYFRSRS